ncbi:hypothetical protein Kpho02_45970 [Kitasatospora phosalacinea]|uniref:Uncharacterized protein n=1 Tax=Kitasatospora phosalacinea TaxID=2065 RepID=A0A9W6QC51_9ACTN|nr:hypothetical protein Kpho02_45970 [Kitasatospora phosalacinea]
MGLVVVIGKSLRGRAPDGGRSELAGCRRITVAPGRSTPPVPPEAPTGGGPPAVRDPVAVVAPSMLGGCFPTGAALFPRRNFGLSGAGWRL